MFELGKSVTHDVGGKRYTFARLERRIVEEWRDWIAEQIGDPFADVERFLDRLSPETAKEWAKEARQVREQLQSFSMGCPLAQRFLASELGLGQLAYLLLRDKHADLTADQAFVVMTELGLRATTDTIRKASGEPPGKNADAPAA